MQIVTDGGMDLAPEQLAGLDVHYVPLTFTLDGRSYVSGVDVQPDEFYQLLASTESFPTTSLPSPGEFAEIYRALAAKDPDILSIHISSGLSGTCDTARAGARLVPEANVTVVDTKTLSGAQGWQVEAAARAVKAGWAKERILALMERVGEATDTLYTLATLKYLIHGGRIGHIKGLLGSVLNIKPIIGVDKTAGKYAQCGQARTLDKAIDRLADIIAERHAPGTTMRVQILHGHNLEGAARLRERLDKLFKCAFLPLGSIAPVLGAHTGPGLVGAVFASAAVFPEVQ